MSNSDDDYEVGYKKPPKSSQLKRASLATAAALRANTLSLAENIQ